MIKLKKLLALVCACAMLGTTLAACSQTDADGDATTTSAASEDGNATTTEGGDTEDTDGSTPLVIGYLEFSQKFSPFYGETSYDMDIAGIVVPSLMTMDRAGAIVYNAIEGETRAYNGTDYTYTGPADISSTLNDDGTVTYNIKMRDDIVCSDGTPLTADDIIFTYYVLSDTSYVGSSTFFATPIIGMTNYRMNNSNAELVTDEAIAEWLASEEAAPILSENIVAPMLTSELEWVRGLYGNADYASYTEAYPETKDLFAAFYSIDETYDSTAVADEAQVLADIIAMYGGNYAAAGEGYAGDASYFAADANQLAIEAVAASMGESAEVPNISGIKKLGDYEVEVTCSRYEANAIYQIGGINVAPMHYYGDASLYDYDNNQFGFTRGDLSIVESKTTQPVGWGPYTFDRYENKVVYLESNPSFYKGAPVTKYLQFRETLDADMISAVSTGTVDISTPSGSLAKMEEIKGHNANGDINGETLVTETVDFLGYGYIGLSGKNVSVGGVADSDASKNLRKAIATILASYRQLTIDSYYGDAATVINYPISDTSWAAPQRTDDGYEVAFSKDVNGNDIFTSDMTADEQYEAAKQAALGFFEAAGYTVENGVLTAAPEGAKLSYEVFIAGGGSGDHPTFALLDAARQTLAEIGFELIINDPVDSNAMWDAMNAGTAEMWVAAWGATVDPDMYQVYHGDNVIGKEGSNESNKYFIDDAALNDLIMEARTSDDQTFRKGLYKEALDIVMDWAVEIPVYQRADITLISAERVNLDTITKDVTTYYGVLAELENIAMN